MQTPLSCTVNISVCLDHPYHFMSVEPHLIHHYFPNMQLRLKGFEEQICASICCTGLSTLTALERHRKNWGFDISKGGGPFGMNHMSRLGTTDCVQQMPSAFEACGDWEISVDHVASDLFWSVPYPHLPFLNFLPPVLI